MELSASVMSGLFESLSDAAKAELMDFAQFLAARERAAVVERQNQAYLEKLATADEQIRKGQVVVKTLQELEAME